MEEKTACWRTGIDAVGQTAEIYPASLQLRHERNQIAHAAAKSVQFPDHQHIAGLKPA